MTDIEWVESTDISVLLSVRAAGVALESRKGGGGWGLTGDNSTSTFSFNLQHGHAYRFPRAVTWVAPDNTDRDRVAETISRTFYGSDHWDSGDRQSALDAADIVVAGMTHRSEPPTR